MDQVGPGANHDERESRFSESCSDSLECEAIIGNTGKLLTRTVLAPSGCEDTENVQTGQQVS